jgi:tetratricopeptide (TPR) repeat protein
VIATWALTDQPQLRMIEAVVGSVTIEASGSSQLIRKADILRNQGQTVAAVAMYRQALSAVEEQGDLESAAACHHMIGVCFKMLGCFDLATSELQLARASYERLGNRAGAGGALRDLGICFDHQGNHETARKWLRASARLLGNEPAELGITLAKLGKSFGDDGQFRLAIRWIARGLAHIRTTDQWFYEMTALMHAGEFQLKSGETGSATTSLWAAVALINEAKAQDEQRRRLSQIFGWLARCYREVGNSKLAERFEERSKSLTAIMDAQTRDVVERELRAA